jgi:hypothetical protein
VFNKGSDNCNAGMLSRLPNPSTVAECEKGN